MRCYILLQQYYYDMLLVTECYPKGTRGEDYRGHANVTVTGSYCKPWKTSGKSYSPEKYEKQDFIYEHSVLGPPIATFIVMNISTMGMQSFRFLDTSSHVI